MQPVKFKQANVTYAENQPEYLPLPAHRTNDGQVTSCWRLTFIERIKVFCRGKIFFTVMTFNQPLQPQLPSVDFIVGVKD